MGAASHLGIDLREYDTRIRTFIPGYEPMLDAAAGALATSIRRRRPVVVDLGIGTGALAASCLAVKPQARVIGIDEDQAMLAVRDGGSARPSPRSTAASNGLSSEL